MTTKILGIVTIVAGVVLAGAAGVTVMATGDGSADDGRGFLDRVHRWAQGMHGEGRHDRMADLIEQLELTPDQVQRLESVHRIGWQGPNPHASMAELHDLLVTQFEQGRVEGAEIRRFIDEHVEQIRLMAYDATDELVALVNSLDERQRGIVREHLQGHGSRGLGHGH